jgi:hypothetical protein
MLGPESNDRLPGCQCSRQSVFADTLAGRRTQTPSQLGVAGQTAERRGEFSGVVDRDDQAGYFMLDNLRQPWRAISYDDRQATAHCLEQSIRHPLYPRRQSEHLGSSIDALNVTYYSEPINACGKTKVFGLSAQYGLERSFADDDQTPISHGITSQSESVEQDIVSFVVDHPTHRQNYGHILRRGPSPAAIAIRPSEGVRDQRQLFRTDERAQLA